MILDILQGGDMRTALISILISVPVILLALTVHEVAHGYVAYLCGDGTAKAFGRLTLNPAKHLDLMGTLCMLIAGFGWAKPVPVNMRNLRKPKRDMVLVSLAGPVANLLLALVAACLYSLTAHIAFSVEAIFANGTLYNIFVTVIRLFSIMIQLNIGLALFNLIPLPPLDGSKILAGLLPNRLAMRYVQIERYTSSVFLIVMILSITGKLDILLYPLQWLRYNISLLFVSLFDTIFGWLF